MGTDDQEFVKILMHELKDKNECRNNGEPQGAMDRFRQDLPIDTLGQLMVVGISKLDMLRSTLSVVQGEYHINDIITKDFIEKYNNSMLDFQIFTLKLSTAFAEFLEDGQRVKFKPSDFTGL